jgi:plasmid stabilization system protein ParE
MSGFVLHPEALADLEGIWDFIAADNVDAAKRVLHQIYEAVHGLVSFPQQGHQRSDLTARQSSRHRGALTRKRVMRSELCIALNLGRRARR